MKLGWAVATVLLAVAAWAASFDVPGKMTPAWDRHSLEVSTSADLSRLWFTVAGGLSIAVVVNGDSGKVAEATLATSGAVDIRGAGRYTVTVTRDSGRGTWDCSGLTGSPELLSFTSFADTMFTPRLNVTTSADLAKWRFTHPDGVTFRVGRMEGNQVVEEQDLDDSDVIELLGPGSFTLQVKPVDGGGAYTATLVQ